MAKQKPQRSFREVDVQLHAFLNTELDGVVNFTIRKLHFWEKETDTQWTRGWVDTRASLDPMERREVSNPAGNHMPFLQLVVSDLTD